MIRVEIPYFRFLNAPRGRSLGVHSTYRRSLEHPARLLFVGA